MNFIYSKRNLVILLIIVGVILRFSYYNDGIWSDEWIAYFFSNPNVELSENYYQFSLHEGAPTFNLFINYFWHTIFGYNYQTTELLSIFSGIFFIILSLYFNSINYNQKLLFLFLIIINPMLIYYSGEIRFYSLSCLLSFLNLIIFYEIIEKRTNIKTVLYILTALISLSINVYTISILIAQTLFCLFFKKDYKYLIYISIIFLIFFIINYNYLFNITSIYANAAGISTGNFNFKFFIGFFFNIYFSDTYFGMFCLLFLLLFTIIYRTKIIKNELLSLIYLVIIFSYLIPISLAYFASSLLWPRHFLFIVPYILYLISFFIFQIKYTNLRNILIIFIIFFSIFINFKDEKSYLVSKPNPENVLKDILKSDIRKIYIENNLSNFIEDKYILSETNKKIEDYDLDYLKIIKNYFYDKKRRSYSPGVIAFLFEETIFIHSENYISGEFTVFSNQNSNILPSEFWTICLYEPLYKGSMNKNTRCLKNNFSQSHIILNSKKISQFLLRQYKKK